MSAPAEYVLAAFGLAGIPGEPLGGQGGRAWRHGDSVLAPATDPVETAWAAGVFESLRVTGIRVARPVRSSDGRWVVGGWSAQRFVAGRPAGRYRETVEASFALHEALARTPQPRFLREREDAISAADRLAWDELPSHDGVRGGVGGGEIGRVFADLAGGRQSVRLPAQLVHGEVFGNVLFAGSAPPAVIGFSPLWRPVSYGAALVVVDAIAWGGSTALLAAHWQHREQWGEMLRRAVLARLALVAAHPRTTDSAVAGILGAAETLRPMMH